MKEKLRPTPTLAGRFSDYLKGSSCMSKLEHLRPSFLVTRKLSYTDHGFISARAHV
jgi:hypothetical protein